MLTISSLYQQISFSDLNWRTLYVTRYFKKHKKKVVHYVKFFVNEEEVVCCLSFISDSWSLILIFTCRFSSVVWCVLYIETFSIFIDAFFCWSNFIALDCWIVLVRYKVDRVVNWCDLFVRSYYLSRESWIVYCV